MTTFSLTQKWDRYWFPDAPLLDLAILRVIAVGTQLALMVFDSRYGLVSLREISELPVSFYRPLPFFRPILAILGGHTFTISEIQTIHIAAIAVGFAALVGLWTRVTLFLFAAGVMLVQLWALSHGDIHHPEAAMMIALGVLALSPAGAVLSLDAWLQRGSRRTTFQQQVTSLSREAKWPILVVQWLFGLMYLSASYSKLSIGGVDWPNGFTLQYYLAMDGLRWNSLLGVWLSQFHWLCVIGQWAVLIFQSTFFLSLIFPKLKWLYVPIGMAMHIGIYLMLKAPFWQWTALYLVFIPWSAALTYMKWMPERPKAEMGFGEASTR
ncbi:hypothetical protein [Novosphingobium sp. KN65.2]|uniref:hypothetical protein n=1 Tax=Novosphingobium sp. KN65.2 TaxID=1478134 RepID=UPI0005E31D29|nr:hypothetical protein [Novosphingobium sp. KN65.2]CDO34527.1 conserved membrane hypothetical protein [Novosphingobium sp. KN65.2]